jgi:hypothetical protein
MFAGFDWSQNPLLIKVIYLDLWMKFAMLCMIGVLAKLALGGIIMYIMDSRRVDSNGQSIPVSLILKEIMSMADAKDIFTKANNLWVFGQHSCPICTDEFELPENTGFLKCGHAFHKNCIEEWLKQNQNCPTCRKPVIVELPV